MPSAGQASALKLWNQVQGQLRQVNKTKQDKNNTKNNKNQKTKDKNIFFTAALNVM
jgi:hypothetical protein